MITDVGNFDREVRAKLVLNTEVVINDVGQLQIRVHTHEVAWRRGCANAISAFRAACGRRENGFLTATARTARHRGCGVPAEEVGSKSGRAKGVRPPPEAGQLMDETRPAIPQEIEAAVGIALIAVEPSFCIPNCPSNVSKLQVS